MVDYSKWDKLNVAADENDEEEESEWETDEEGEEPPSADVSKGPAIKNEEPTSSPGETPIHSTPKRKGPFVDIDPRDDPFKIMKVVREEDPAVWRPKARVCERWGIMDEYGDEQQSGPASGMARAMRQMQTQMIYRGRDTPEVQFIKKLAERKDAEIKAAKSEAMQRYKQDYVIKLYMPELDPTVRRRFKVSGGIVLNTLADKILMPIMGWVRNYHAYVFCDRKDGACFGPKDSNAIDTVHVAFSYFHLMDDKKYKLGDVLTQKGALMGWTYDIGDMWRHELEVEEIRSPEESTGTCELLEGSGRCPPEDGHGNFRYNKTLQILKNKKHPEYRKKLAECGEACNVSGRFDYAHFDLTERQRALKEALASPASTQSGSKMYTTSMQFGGNVSDLLRRHAKKGERLVEVSPGCVHGPTLSETISTRADKKDLSLCANCGKPDAQSRCGQCRILRYCSKDCQRHHWKEGGHRRACVPKR